MYYAASTQGFYDPAIHTTLPADAVPISDAEHAALLAGQSDGWRITPGPDGRPTLAPSDPPSAEEITARIVAEAQARLDAFARERGYDHILSACTYAGSAVPQFALEGAACVALRDATWAALYAIQAEVAAGTRPVPASFDDILPDLPALVWPDAPSPSPEA